MEGWASPSWNVYFEIAAWHSRIDSNYDGLDVGLDAGPAGSAQNDNRYAAIRQILLVLEVGVGGDQHRKAGQLGSLKKLAVLQS